MIPVWLLFFGPLAFFVCEGVYYVCNCKRAFGLLRLPFEIIAMLILPSLFFGISFFSPDLYFEKPDEGLGLIIIGVLFMFTVPCVFAYFISAYRKILYSALTEGLLNFLLVAGIGINIVVALLVFYNIHFMFALFGNLPVIIALGMALVQNLRLQPEKMGIELV